MWGLDKIVVVKYLALCLLCGKYWINISSDDDNDNVIVFEGIDGFLKGLCYCREDTLRNWFIELNNEDRC